MQLCPVVKLRVADCWPKERWVKRHSTDWGNDWGSQEKDSAGWLERQTADW